MQLSKIIISSCQYCYAFAFLCARDCKLERELMVGACTPLFHCRHSSKLSGACAGLRQYEDDYSNFSLHGKLRVHKKQGSPSHVDLMKALCTI